MSVEEKEVEDNVEVKVENEAETLENEVKSDEKSEAVDDEPEVEEEPTLEEKIEALDENIVELKNSRVRVVAEFDNYKRRTAKEHLRLIATANEDLMKDLLPVLENFERGLSEENKSDNVEAIYKGVDMIYTQFLEVLTKSGLKEDNPMGEEFDSEKHDAMMHVESDEIEEDNIVQVFQKGYLLKEKVIQFAKVSVSKGNS